MTSRFQPFASQIFFAIMIGFALVLLFDRGGSLWPCILAHAVIDVLSVLAKGTEWGSYLYIGATIVIGAAYSLWLAKLPSAFSGP